MSLTDSLPTGDTGGLTVADERLILAGLVAKNADGTPRVGVFPSGTTPLVTGRASMGYDVAPFQAATSRTGTGVELLANDAITTVVTTAAPGANSRIDVIWVRPQFTANADSGNVPLFGVTQGVAAGVPTAPAIPDGALELATAEILSTTTTTGTAVITQSAPFTAASGGSVLMRNDPELQAWTPGDGAVAHRLDNDATYDRINGAWVTSDLWTAFTPTWTASFSGPTVGNGTLTGRYKYVGRKAIAVRYALTFGSTTSGGAGEWLFTLPSGIAAHSAGEQVMPCRVSLSGPGWAFAGVAVVTPSATTVAPFLSESITSTVLKHARNANSAGAPGTGIPIVGSGYSYSTGSTLVIEGVLEIA